MVAMSLRTISPSSRLSGGLKNSGSSVPRDQQLNAEEDEQVKPQKPLPKYEEQNRKLGSYSCLDPPPRFVDLHSFGINGAQNESSLFSSSLSDLFSQKVRLSANGFLFHQSASTITTHNDTVESPVFAEETQAHAINNLLPDEEELLTGMVNETGHVTHFNGVDDMGEFDLFSSSGGIELEADDRARLVNKNVDSMMDMAYNKSSSDFVSAGYRASGEHLSSRVPNSSRGAEVLLYESSQMNRFASPFTVPSLGHKFDLSAPIHPVGQVNFDTRHTPSFHPHSVRTVHDSVGNIDAQNLDNAVGICSDACAKVTEWGVHHSGLNGNSVELNEGVLGCSPNDSRQFNVHQWVHSKSDSYQHHPSKSIFLANSPSFVNGNAHCLPQLPHNPVVPHVMINAARPMNGNHVGSAPAINGALWDRRQVHAGESIEPSSFNLSSTTSVGVLGSSPVEISSHFSFPRVHGTFLDISENMGLHSPQKTFYGRNPLDSVPSSYGSPSERARFRRTESVMNNAEKKHYELNINRISRGEDRRTTLMIKNIPNKYTSKMLLATIDENHRGTYDFIYLPIDFKNKCNVGYAFINMVDPLHVMSFHQTFEGKKWEKFNSEKVATLAYARIQGRAALIAHFQNSSLMNEDKRCRPILFHTDGPNAGDQEPFPMSSNTRLKPGS